MNKKKSNYWLALVANVLVGVALIYILTRALGPSSPKEVPYSDFLD